MPVPTKTKTFPKLITNGDAVILLFTSNPTSGVVLRDRESSPCKGPRKIGRYLDLTQFDDCPTDTVVEIIQ